MRCAHCGATARDASLWKDIVAIAELVVCCLVDELPWR
jgi:hypothetical protein